MTAGLQRAKSASALPYPGGLSLGLSARGGSLSQPLHYAEARPPARPP
jgi:hypothetical protein